MPRPEVSQAAELLYGRLWPQTIEDEINEWHLLLFCEAVAGTLFEQVRSYVSDREDMQGWSVIFNVHTCPPEALDYLGQIVGIHFEDSLTVQQKREKIIERPAFKRGTVGALTAAVKQHLTGAKFVFLVERFEGHAYRLFIRTFTSQTPEPAQTLADILSQKPAGLKLDFEVLDGKTYLQWRTEYKTYAGVKAKGTYAQALAA